MLPRTPGFGDIPEETARVAHIAFPKGNPYIRLRDELGPIYDLSITHKLGLFVNKIPSGGNVLQA